MVRQFEFVIVRQDDQLSSSELKSRLESTPCWDRSIQLQILKSELDTRPTDPTFLSAIAAGSAAIGALFGALGGIAQSLGKQRIVVRWQNGASVEVEGRNAEDIIQRVIPLLASEPDSKIVISV
jgi:hypothetical protein